ncbi:hypothetical protein [Enterovibrio baiacu]|uniref:hypothetical protein n=1 Tax=Enterovibrio baiacu TaxID=2491023 RepID=UPI001010554D|nr:hypothetical protein [Enterovibrio baiacu]MBE1275568.1 hypothetical protein [Enterovibrio baiacu]
MKGNHKEKTTGETAHRLSSTLAKTVKALDLRPYQSSPDSYPNGPRRCEAWLDLVEPARQGRNDRRRDV